MKAPVLVTTLAWSLTKMIHSNTKDKLVKLGLTAKQEREMMESDTVSTCQEDKFCLMMNNSHFKISIIYQVNLTKQEQGNSKFLEN